MRIFSYIIPTIIMAIVLSGCGTTSQKSLSVSPKMSELMFDQSAEPDFATPVTHDFRATPKPKSEPKVQSFPFFVPEGSAEQKTSEPQAMVLGSKDPEFKEFVDYSDNPTAASADAAVPNSVAGVSAGTAAAGSAFAAGDIPTNAAPATVPGFSSSELAHVKFSNQNLFANASSFVIDLDQQRKEACYPIRGKLISPYGMRGRRMHTGADLKAAHGDHIYAVFDGTVRMAKPYGGYGNVVVVRHGNGLETLYSHNSKNMVRPGDKVKAGDVIALAGRTGSASTEHLHFEVRVQGQVLHPGLLLDFTNRQIQSGKLVIRKNGSSITAQRKQGSEVDTQESPEPVLVPPGNATASTTSPTSSAAKAGKTSSSATAAGGEKYHTIVSGDTLYALSLKYKTSVSSICSLNKITPKTTLSLGRKLRVK